MEILLPTPHWLQSVDEGVSGCGRCWADKQHSGTCLKMLLQPAAFFIFILLRFLQPRWDLLLSHQREGWLLLQGCSLRMFIKKVLLSHSLIICYCLNPLPHVSGIARVTVETFNLSSIHRLITSHTHTDPGTTGTQAVLDTYCNI